MAIPAVVAAAAKALGKKLAIDAATSEEGRDNIIKILIAVIAVPLIIIVIVIGSVSSIFRTVPVIDDEKLYLYQNIVTEVNKDKGLDINYKEVLAVDAVRYMQDFTKADELGIRSTIEYFIIKHKHTETHTSTKADGSSYTYTTYYYTYEQRDLSEALDMLVKDNIIADKEDVMTFLLIDEPDQIISDNINDYVDPNFKPDESNYLWPTGNINGYYAKITSPFGERICPFHGKEFHTGIDIAVPMYANIQAIADGTVTWAGAKGSYGNAVIIDHGDGMTTLYAHNTYVIVSVGDKVTKGQSIAAAGSTGASTGPHCHFEIRINNEPKNPVNYYK